MIASIFSVASRQQNESPMRIIRLAIEAEVTNGIGIHLIGLPDVTTKEALLRVVTAIQNSGFVFPGKKIVINIKDYGEPLKTGDDTEYLDLPIALAILSASGQINPITVDRWSAYGRLKLDGHIELPSFNSCYSVENWEDKERLKACTLKEAAQFIRIIN